MSEEDLNCKNRRVVNVGDLLYSPAYDFERDPGLAYSSFEIHDGAAMCYWNLCAPGSYNAWAVATANYIDNELVVKYNKVLGRAKSKYQGGILPQDVQDLLNQVHDFIVSWDEADIKPNRTFSENFWHPTESYWNSEVRGIVNFFDEAACKVDILKNIADGPLESGALIAGAPQRTLEPAPGGGGYFKGPPTNGDKGGGSTMGKALGIMAIGAAGYFGFKVLTE